MLNVALKPNICIARLYIIIIIIIIKTGARGGVVVKALRYKSAGRGFESRWCQWNFSAT